MPLPVSATRIATKLPLSPSSAGLPVSATGSTLMRSDQFHASNTFHGIDLGMTGEVMRGPWTVAATAKVVAPP